MHEKQRRTLFISMLTISAFTIGGGYVIAPLMKKKFVDELGWLEEKVMLDIIAMSTSSPGLIAVNSSILVGYRLFGILGSFIALVGMVLPPLLIMFVVFFFYDAFSQNTYVSAALNGMGAAVVALLVDVIYSMTKGVIQQKDLFNILIMIIAFVAAFFFNISIILIIVSACVIGLIRTEISRYLRGGSSK